MVSKSMTRYVGTVCYRCTISGIQTGLLSVSDTIFSSYIVAILSALLDHKNGTYIIASLYCLFDRILSKTAKLSIQVLYIYIQCVTVSRERSTPYA